MIASHHRGIEELLLTGMSLGEEGTFIITGTFCVCMCVFAAELRASA